MQGQQIGPWKYEEGDSRYFKEQNHKNDVLVL